MSEPLTFYKLLAATVTDSCRFKLFVFDWCLVCTALATDDLATSPAFEILVSSSVSFRTPPAVMSSVDQGELVTTDLAHGDPLVRDPDGG